MDSSSVEYKLKKYTHKLRNASTLQEAELYQNKLKYYHNINKNGGTYYSEESIKDIKDDITNKLKKATEQIQNIKDFSIDDFDELSEKVSDLYSDIKKIKKKTDKSQGIFNISKKKKSINDNIPEMSEFNIENYLSN